MKKLIVICAQQRSGTTVLQKGLDSTKYVKNYGEIFHSKMYEKKSEYSFHLFKKKIAEKNRHLHYPSRANSERIFRRYINNLRSKTDKEYILIDIKYNSWHHFNPIWHLPLEEPFLLKLLEKYDAKIIHVIRNNKFNQYVSRESARNRKVWHLKNNEKLDKISLDIDPVECKEFILNAIINQNLYERWLEHYPNKLTIEYESMFKDGLFDPKVLTRLNNLVDLNLDIPPKPLLNKIVLDPAEIVSNFNSLTFDVVLSDYRDMLITN